MSKTIAVDFDGVLYPKEAYTTAGDFSAEPCEGAAHGMVALRDSGYEIVIHTCRLTTEVCGAHGAKWVCRDIKTWLKKHGIPYDLLWGREGKPVADVYLDDRAFRHISWDKTTGELL